MQTCQDSKIDTDLVASATGNHITSSNATQNGPPPPHAPHASDYPCSSANTAPTPTPTMAERAHPCNNNRGQPRTAKDSPEKTPEAPRTLGDEPTDSLQGRGGGRGILPLPNCGDAHEGELAPVPNP